MEEDAARGLSASPAPALHDAHATFGIFDSLTLAERRLPPMDLDEDLEDDFGDGDVMPWADDDDGEIDFQSSLDDVTKIDDLTAGQGRLKRTGERRGRQDPEKSCKTIKVPTKYHDGPTPAASGSMLHELPTKAKK